MFATSKMAASVAAVFIAALCLGTVVKGQSVSSVSPLKGQEGTLVTITGADLGTTNKVSLAPFDTTNYDVTDGGALKVTAAADGKSVKWFLCS